LNAATDKRAIETTSDIPQIKLSAYTNTKIGHRLRSIQSLK